MLYKEKKPKFPINAFKFEDIYKVDYSLVEHLNLKSPIDFNIEGVCGHCGNSIREHLIYERQSICPNSYIIYEGNEVIGVMSISNFESIYEPFVCDDLQIVEEKDKVTEEETPQGEEENIPMEEDNAKSKEE